MLEHVTLPVCLAGDSNVSPSNKFFVVQYMHTRLERGTCHGDWEHTTKGMGFNVSRYPNLPVSHEYKLELANHLLLCVSNQSACRI